MPTEADACRKLILPKLYSAGWGDGQIGEQCPFTDMLKLPPISRHDNVAKIVGAFGGPDELRTAVNQLQELPYAP